METSNNLEKLALTRKSGQERFHRSGESAGFDVFAFWQWSASDLISNATRGCLAEFLVAKALGIALEVRVEWDAYDLVLPNGTKIEVKSAAYCQSWWQSRFSRITFSIAPTVRWNAENNTLEGEKGRWADIYVFCLLHHRDKSTLDPLDLSQWTFYVVPTTTLNEKLPRQKSLSLNGLKALGSPGVAFNQLSREVLRQAP